MIDNIKKILILNFNRLGEVLFTTPAICALKENYPDAKIVSLSGYFGREVLKRVPIVDETLLLPKKFADRISLIKYLRTQKFDLAIFFSFSFDLGIYGFFSGAKYRVGHFEIREGNFLFTNIKAKKPKNVHMINYYASILEPLNIKFKNKKYIFHTSDKDIEFANNFFSTEGINKEDIIISLNPGATRPQNRWPDSNFAKLADLLQENLQAKVLLLGGKQDISIVEEILKLMKTKPIVATGKTDIGQLSAILKKSNILIAGDTGPLHLATAVDTKTIALFGAANPIQTGPYGDGHIIINKNLKCSPCYKKPTCKNFDCMRKISVEDVFNEIKKQLK